MLSWGGGIWCHVPEDFIYAFVQISIGSERQSVSFRAAKHGALVGVTSLMYSTFAYNIPIIMTIIFHCCLRIYERSDTTSIYQNTLLVCYKILFLTIQCSCAQFVESI